MKILHYTTFLALFIFSLNSQAQYTWEEVIVPDSVDVKMTAFNSNGNQFIASNHGVYYSEDGFNWYKSGLSYYVSYIYINFNNTIYAGMNSLFRSFDDGIKWESIFYSAEGGIMSICTKGDSIVLVGTWGGIFRSIDSGQTWSHVLDTYNSEVFNDIVYNNEGTLFAGSISYIANSPGGVYRSDDNGATWILDCLEYHFVSSIVINSEDEIFVGTRGHGYYGGGRVLKSIDDGLNWDVKYENNLIESMAKNLYGDIAIGCDSQNGGESGGILVSYDDGENWEDITNNLPTRSFDQVIFSPDQHLYTVTHFEDRLFRTDNPVSISEASISDSFNHFRLFPNPAFDRLTIIFKENISHNIEDIIIFNTLGIKVKQIPVSQNVKEIVVDVSNLEAGIYFAVMKAEGIDVATGKFLKVK